MSKNKKVFLTNHSKVRFSERTNYQSNEQEQLATSAFRYGHEFAECTEPLSTFLKSISYDAGKYVAKIYKDNVYIFNNFCGHRLLTVYAVPEEYLPIDKYLIQKEELNRCMIALTDKKTNKISYWHEFGGLTDDICEALEFTNQVKATNYINNNQEIDSYKDTHEIEIF